MEEVSFDSQGTKYVLVDGQTVILRKNLQLNNIPDVNVDILQGALNGVNISPSKNISCLQTSIPSNSNNCLRSNEFVIASEAQKSDCDTVVQLSIQETNDLGLQYSIEPSEIKGNSQKEGSQNVLSESYFYHHPVEQNDSINGSVSSAGSINVQNTFDLGKYNDLIQIPSSNDDVNQQVTLIPHYLNGQLSYTLQLSDQSSPFEFSQTESVENGNILTSNNVSSKNESLTNVLKCTPVSIAPLLPNLEQSSTLEKVIASSGLKTNGVTVNSHETSTINLGKEPLTYIIPAKTLLPNTKPRILASSKNSQRIIKLMEANGKLQISPYKNQLLLVGKRKIAPLKMALPPLNPGIKKRPNPAVNTKQVVIKSIIKGDPSSMAKNVNVLNNSMKQQLPNLAGKSVISSKNNEYVVIFIIIFYMF